jgi:DNA-binding NtrC family response regulator
MGSVQRLRQIRVLLASRDPRFANTVNFLLRRHGLETVRARRLGRLDELIERSAVNLAIFDVDSFSAYSPMAVAVAYARRRLPVIAMSKRPDRIAFAEVCPLPKWGPFERLLEEIERLHAERSRTETLPPLGPRSTDLRLVPRRTTDVVA